MQATAHVDEEQLVQEFLEQVDRAHDSATQRDAFRRAFALLRTHLQIYPTTTGQPSTVFESAAATVRGLGRHCLPLAVAVAMHLYPVCALQCFPLPLLSIAWLKRSILQRTIRSRSLILANAGGERSRGCEQTLIARETADGIEVNGTCEYMSLSSVADVVLFKAQFADGAHALCAADLRGNSVHIGPWKFDGRMRLSDTSAVTFTNHRVPRGRYARETDRAGVQYIADYQRCWFHLFLAELYLTRVEQLRHLWELPRSSDYVARLEEISELRQRALHLLDKFSGEHIASLMTTSSVLKLRVSLLSQATAASLRAKGAAASDVEMLAADATELCYIKWQPTADDRILAAALASPT